MVPVTQPTTHADATSSSSGAASAAVGVAAEAQVKARLIEQVKTLMRQSGNEEQFDDAAWVDRWLRRPNHALGGAAPELYINTPEGEALLTRLIGAMAAGSYM